MTVYLVNPSHLSFGVGVITPRWLFVLAGATPAVHGEPQIVDETLEPFDIDAVQAGDVVGIGIHTGNALRGYEIGKLRSARGATVVFGGIHATLYPDEARELGDADAVVRGDGDVIWPLVLDDAMQRDAARDLRGRTCRCRPLRAGALGAAAAGPLHVGIRADRPRVSQALFVLLGVAYRRPETAAARGRQRRGGDCRAPASGFRFVALADDNFYPVTLADLAMAERQKNVPGSNS